jgi:hypothetical protein
MAARFCTLRQLTVRTRAAKIRSSYPSTSSGVLMNASQPGTDQARVPSPALLMQLGLAYRSSAVLFAAVNLDIFTLLSSGPKTAEQLAEACGAHPRAIRSLNACVVEGLRCRWPDLREQRGRRRLSRERVRVQCEWIQTRRISSRVGRSYASRQAACVMWRQQRGDPRVRARTGVPAASDRSCRI